MIDAAGITRLLGLSTHDRPIVSVYLTVPLDPAQRRGMPAHLDDVLAQSSLAPGDGEDVWARARRAEIPAIRQELSAHAHEWLGHSVAIFACTRAGLLETIPLRGQVRELAVIGPRPYVRPLLAELKRSPSYVVAVVDRRHAWLFRVCGDSIEPVDHLRSQTPASKRFGGWHGFQAYRNAQRARRLARQHFAAAASALAGAVGGPGAARTLPGATGEGNGGPLVVAGHESETSEFLGTLPPAVRKRVAGTFVIDPHTMTPARVRQLADEVITAWQDSRERELAAALAAQAPGAMTAIGVDACVAAANQHAIQLLLVPDDEVRPGFTCERCGALAVASGSCQACGEPRRPVGDVIEELAVKVTRDGGSVQPVRSDAALAEVAARRRFPARSA